MAMYRMFDSWIRALWIYCLTATVHATEPPNFVGTQQCAGCHKKEHDSWSASHHSWAWRLPTAANVLGDFDDADFQHKGFRYRFLTQEGAYFIVADGPDGSAIRYPLKYVVGVTPLQQYLVETAGGRLQALDVVWDIEQKRWYHLYPTEDVSAGNGMHWSGPYKNWNARCAECHATDYRKNYDPRSDSYSSTQAEIGVGCEACHGPGEAHIAWAKAPNEFLIDNWHAVDERGLIRAYVKGDAASETNLCAGCHARREPVGSSSPVPGSAFDDHYRLVLLREGLYFPDGQIQEEVYVYGSFLQSKMHSRGVTCSRCHDMHSGQLKADGNAVCTQCHNPAGNPDFPTLTKSSYDDPAHHFHERGTEGAACVNCHMPSRDYMGIDGRRDHSFRIPRPDLAQTLGTPEPCSGCHTEKSAVWAAAEISKRFKDKKGKTEHFAPVFHQAGKQLDENTIRQLLDIANDVERTAIVRASALQRLSGMDLGDRAGQLARLAKNPETPVRLAVAGLLARLPAEQRVEIGGPMLSDRARSVRIETAKALLAIPPNALPNSEREALQRSMRELQASMRAKADFPEIQMVLGGMALVMRNLPAAAKAFEQAVEMDPQLVDAWRMLARIHAAQGNRESTRNTLEAAIGHNQDKADLREMLKKLE
jgi:predicted CXXCH cytochrome family protein